MVFIQFDVCLMATTPIGAALAENLAVPLAPECENFAVEIRLLPDWVPKKARVDKIGAVIFKSRIDI